MSVKNFYANSWQAQSPGLYKGLNRRMTNLSRLGQGLESLASTNQIYGQGADSMKAYISEVHLSLIQTLLTTVQTFQTAVGVYWQGYQEVDRHGDFRLVSDDLRAHVRDTGNAINHMTGFEQHIRRVANSVSHIVGLGSAGSGAIARVRSDLESMQRLARDQHASWSSYEDHDPGFDQVEEMMASAKRLLTQIGQLSVGRAYNQGSFFDLDGIADLEHLLNKVGDYNANNMPVAQAGWQSMFDEYVKDVTAKEERLAKADNRHKGAWEILFGIGAVVLGTAAIILTAGMATPLVIASWATGLSVSAYGLSNVFEGSQIVVTGANKVWNPLRDTLFQGNQNAYDLFGNIAMFASGTVIPVGAALNTGRTVISAIVSGTGRSLLTSGVGVATNMVIAPVATSLAKQLSINQLWSRDIGTATGFGASMFVGGRAYSKTGIVGMTEPLPKVNKSVIREFVNAKKINQTFPKEYQSPYKPTTTGVELMLTEQTSVGEFARVYTEGKTSPAGGWLMRLDDLKKLSPKQIQEKFALPEQPTHIVDVILPKGTTLREGVVNSAFGFKGTGIQFDLQGQRIGEFINNRPLP